MRPLNDPLPADGAVMQNPKNKPEGGLDESLLDSVLARRPRGISQATYGINPRIDSFAPKSPAEIVAWFEKFLAAFAAPANSAPTIAY